jgi:DNA-binding IclR family transcriptional regulator
VIRTEGYAVADQELELGLWGLAVPLHSHDGRVSAALSVSSPSARDPQVSAILPPLRTAAAEISRAIGYQPATAPDGSPGNPD